MTLEDWAQVRNGFGYGSGYGFGDGFGDGYGDGSVYGDWVLAGAEVTQ